MLEIVNLSKSYKEKKVLDNINLKLENGLYGLLRPKWSKLDSGKILWNGQESKILGAKYREILGYMPQGQGLYNGFTAKRFLNYIAVLKEVPKEEIEMQIQKVSKSMN